MLPGPLGVLRRSGDRLDRARRGQDPPAHRFGPRGARFLKIWLERPERVFSSLLLGNTVANIGASALAGSIAAELGFNHAVAVATVVMTLAVLFFCEVTPKTLAKRYAETFVLATLPLISLLYWLLRAAGLAAGPRHAGHQPAPHRQRGRR